MNSSQKRFQIKKFRFITDTGSNWERYMITDNCIPFFRINQWLELKSIKKATTGKEYGKKLVIFLNWLDSHGASFENATNYHVQQFLHFLIFGSLQDERILSVQSTLSSSTLQSYITVITSAIKDRKALDGGKSWTQEAADAAISA